MVHQLQQCSLVEVGEGVEQFLRLLLALQSLGVGEVGLACEGACPHVAIAEEVTVEELPAVGTGRRYETLLQRSVHAESVILTCTATANPTYHAHINTRLGFY